MKLTISEVRGFHPVKYFKENTDNINSLSFTDNGESVISSSDDDQIILYDCTSGTVVSLSMSPVDDTFLSGALDGTVRLWDLRSPNCHGVMHVSGRPTAAFDPEGLVFAAGINSEYLNLYDLRSFDKGPFGTFKPSMSEFTGTEWTSLKFSPDGRTILICTNGSYLRLVNSFTGAHLHSFNVGNNTEKQNLDACFTPTSQFIISASPDSMLHVFSVETGVRMAQLATYETASKMVGPQARINCVAFNPKFAMMATGSMQTCFWLPNIDNE